LYIEASEADTLSVQSDGSVDMTRARHVTVDSFASLQLPAELGSHADDMPPGSEQRVHPEDEGARDGSLIGSFAGHGMCLLFMSYYI
jgi:hypothetical protein